MIKGITRTAVHTWSVYRLREKMERLGWVEAVSEIEALDAACADYGIPVYDRRWIIVLRED